jgi:protease I
MKVKTILCLAAITLSGCSMFNKGVKHSREGDQKLDNMRVAILVTDGFEQVEMTEPRKALEEAGARTVLIAPHAGYVQGYNHDEKGDTFLVDLPLDEAHVENFDALLLPGGVQNPDKLRTIPEAVKFVQKMSKAHRPIAAICHGPWILINAGLVNGLTMTSWPSLELDLKNAKAHWVDKPVVVDKNIVTSRKPEDIPEFNKEMIKLFAKKK